MAKPNNLVNRLNYGVRAEGEMVVFTLGNADIEFDYETAFEISQLMRFAAKQAKLVAGDHSRHWSSIGNLADIEENYKSLILPNMRFEPSSVVERIVGKS